MSDVSTDLPPEPPLRDVLPVDALRALLHERLRRVGAALPEHLRGVLQLAVEDQGDAQGFALIDVNGAGTTSAAGVAATARAWLYVDAREVDRFLHGTPLSAGAVRVTGDRDFVLELLQSLDAAPRAGSALDIRLRGGTL